MFDVAFWFACTDRYPIDDDSAYAPLVNEFHRDNLAQKLTFVMLVRGEYQHHIIKLVVEHDYSTHSHRQLCETHTTAIAGRNHTFINEGQNYTQKEKGEKTDLWIPISAAHDQRELPNQRKTPNRFPNVSNAPGKQKQLMNVTPS